MGTSTTQYFIEKFGYAIGLPVKANYDDVRGVFIPRVHIENLSDLAGGGPVSLGVSAGTLASTYTALTFADSNNVSFGVDTDGVITATAAAGGGGLSNINLSAGTTSNNLSAATFNNANGVSFGLNGSIITASVETNYQTPGAYLTTAAVSDHSHGASAANGSFPFRTLSFSNANGVSFGTSAGSAITASHNGLTTAALSDHSHGNPQLNLTNLSGTTASNSNGLTLSLSAAPPTAPETPFGVSAGTQSVSTGTLVFSNSNGVSFGMSGSSRITASHNGLTTAAASDHSHGNPQLNLTNISGTTASNSAGFTLSLSAANPVGGGLTNINVSAGTTSNNLSAVTFADSNGVSFGLNGSVVTATVATNYQSQGAYLTTAALSNHSHGASGQNGSFAFQTLSFSNANGISFGTSAGNAITASHNALTTARASNDGVGLNTAQTNVTWTVNSSGISLNAAGYAGTGTSATNASVTLNSNGLAISVSPGGGVNPAASASNGSFAFTTLNFSNANNVTFGTSAGGIITASVAAPGAAAENNWFNLAGNTAGNTTASGSTIALSGGNNITLSGTNGSQIRIDGPASSSLVGTSGISVSVNGSTISILNTVPANGRFVNEPSITQVGTVQGNSLVSVVPFILQNRLNMSNLRFGASVSGATQTNTSSAFLDVSASAVLYSLNGSTLSSILSGSNSYSIVHQSNSTASKNGIRAMTLAFASTTQLQPGEYWLALHISTNNTATGGAATTALGHSLSMLVGATAGTAALGMDPLGVATAASRGASIGLGLLSTGATLASFGVSDVTQSGTRGMVAKLWLDFRNYSVW